MVEATVVVRKFRRLHPDCRASIFGDVIRNLRIACSRRRAVAAPCKKQTFRLRGLFPVGSGEAGSISFVANWESSGAGSE
jgi:hypothetical protein